MVLHAVFPLCGDASPALYLFSVTLCTSCPPFPPPYLHAVPILLPSLLFPFTYCATGLHFAYIPLLYSSQRIAIHLPAFCFTLTCCAGILFVHLCLPLCRRTVRRFLSLCLPFPLSPLFCLAFPVVGTPVCCPPYPFCATHPCGYPSPSPPLILLLITYKLKIALACIAYSPPLPHLPSPSRTLSPAHRRCGANAPAALAARPPHRQRYQQQAQRQPQRQRRRPAAGSCCIASRRAFQGGNSTQ